MDPWSVMGVSTLTITSTKIMKLGCLIPRTLFYKTSKSTNVFTNVSICAYGGLWVSITTIPNSKVMHPYRKAINMCIVSLSRN